MKRIRWSEAASGDLQGINQYLREHYPSYRKPTIRRLYAAARSLKKYPNRGRTGKQENTRELLVAPMPYLIVYAVEPQRVNILRIMHTSQQWP